MEGFVLVAKRKDGMGRVGGEETRRNMKDTKRDEEKESGRGRAAVTY